MPIHCPIATQRITQDEFKQIAGEVMQHVFTIHNEFGRWDSRAGRVRFSTAGIARHTRTTHDTQHTASVVGIHCCPYHPPRTTA